MSLQSGYATAGYFLPGGVGGQVGHVGRVVGCVEGADEIGVICVVKGEAGGDVLADRREGAGNAGYARAQAFHGGHAEAFVVGKVDGAAAVALHELLQLFKGKSPVLHPVRAGQGKTLRQAPDEVDADVGGIASLAQPAFHSANAQNSELVREGRCVEKDISPDCWRIGAGLIIEADAHYRRAAAGAEVLVAALVEPGGGKHEVRDLQAAQSQGAEVEQLVAGEGGISFAQVLFVVFPVHIVQVAGEFGFAQSGKEWRKSLRQDGPVRLDAADCGAYTCLVPPYAAKASRHRFVGQVQVHLGWEVGENVRALLVAKQV